jgi:hypothetical protein
MNNNSSTKWPFLWFKRYKHKLWPPGPLLVVILASIATIIGSIFSFFNK